LKNFNKKFLAIIVFYKSDNEILNCLNGIHSQKGNITIYLHLNSVINRKLLGQIQQYEPIIIEYTGNIGFGNAVNAGFKYAIKNNFDYAVLVNPDIKITNINLLNNLYEANCLNNEKSIISPFHYQSISSNIIDPKFKRYISTSQKTNIDSVVESDFVNAAFWLVPIPIILEVGGFDPIFFLYGEDANFIHRLKLKEYKILVHKNLKIEHLRASQLENPQHYLHDLKGYVWHSIIISQLNYILTFGMFTKIIAKNIIDHPKYFFKICVVLFHTLFNFNKLTARKNQYSKGAFLS
jgi:GT2 family glycosyltransferase